jgi:hypothetical protein
LNERKELKSRSMD